MEDKDKVQEASEENAEESKENAKELTGKDSIYRELQSIFGWIDSLDKPSLMRNLKKYNQNPTGTVESLRKRLKYYMKMRKLASVNICTSEVKTLFPYYVVLDFEATCNEINPPDYPHEIIEFPAVLVNTQTLTIVDQFQAFVKPVVNPTLSPFCISLTSISQEQVDDALEFPEVLEKFERWLAKHKLGTKNKYAMVTDGPWDMGRFLYGQCKLSGISYPHFGKKWINLRRSYSSFYKCEKMRLQLMLEKLGMKFEGHPHCGIDDATNIAYLLIQMIKDGAALDINERISLNNKLDHPFQNGKNNKSSWPVKPFYTQSHTRTYSQALKDKQQAADTMSKLKAGLQHHIEASS